MNWGETLRRAFDALWIKVAAFVPNLAAAVLLILIGYLVSALLRRVTTAVLKKVGFDRASEQAGLQGVVSRAGIQKTPSEIVGGVVFWLFMLTFLLTSAESLGLERVSGTVDAFILYLPKVVGATIILVVGLILSQFVRDAVRSAAGGIGVEYAKGLGGLVYGVLIIVVSVLAIGQLEIETALLAQVISIILIAAGAAIALSLGLGTRELARNLTAGIYARELYKTGAIVTLGEESGEVEGVGTVSTAMKTSHGVVYVPNCRLVEGIVRVSDRERKEKKPEA